MDLRLMNNSNMSDKLKALILSVSAFCAIFKVIKSGCYNFFQLLSTLHFVPHLRA